MLRIRTIACAVLLLLGSGIRAQEGDFNPSDPAEPQVPVFYYPLTVKCEPAGAGYASGNGRYVPGTSVNVSTSAYAGYTFSHWLLNGEPYDATDMRFSYVTTEETMDFTAVYDFTPNDPSEPTMNVKSRLFLNSEPEGICTFNRTSGAYVAADQYVSVSVTGVDQLYEFVGWYQDGELLTDLQSFNFLVEYNDATLTARFKELPFDPESPDDPMSSPDQTDIQTGLKGDANEDGVVNVTDAVAVINAYVHEDNSRINVYLADMNDDGEINITDAVGIINVYLNAE